MSATAIGLPVASQILRTKDAAAFLGNLSESTLERWRTTGGGPDFIKLGPGKRAAVGYLLQDLEAFIAKSRHSSTSEYGCKP